MKPNDYKKNLKARKGSFTIEAAVIMAPIMFFIILLVYVGLLLYQQVKIQSDATLISERTANIFTDTSKDIYIGAVNKDNYKDLDPYWRILGNGNYTKSAKDKGMGYMTLLDGAYNLIKSDQNAVPPSISISNFLDLDRTITVKIESNVYVPFPKILTYFGVKKDIVLEGYSKSEVPDNAEFIRNIDLGVDIFREVDDKTGITDKIQSKFQKVKDGWARVKSLFG